MKHFIVSNLILIGSIVFSSQSAQAQLLYAKESRREQHEKNVTEQLSHLPSPFSDSSLSDFIYPIFQSLFSEKPDTSYLPTKLSEDLAYFSKVGELSDLTCDSELAYDYAVAKTISGDYKECQRFASSCTEKQTAPLALALQGARCYSLDYKFSEAKELYDSVDVNQMSRDDRSTYTLEYAAFALGSVYADQVDSIIASHSEWSEEEKSLAKGLVEFYIYGVPLSQSKDDVYNFLGFMIKSSAGYLNKYLKALRIHIYYDDYEHELALKILAREAVDLINPLDWWSVAYNILYAHSDGNNFDSAREIYDAFAPHSHSRSLGLPVERNTYNYTQIFNEVCRDTTLQDKNRNDFSQMLQLWKAGEMSVETLIDYIAQPENNLLGKADSESTLASLYSIIGDYDKAREHYWNAHLLCPYFNRAHWGLVLLERQTKYRSYPEYEQNEKFVTDTLNGIEFPDELASYVPNYNSFNELSKNKIKYGMRIWAPYIKQFHEIGYSSYIKLPYELLSDSPNLSDLKDVRIGPPALPNHKFDNRLWDDVRGAGGEQVVADHDEVFMTVHGDYNLLGHEVAHQFHRFIQVQKPNLFICIDSLYKKARERNLFADGYASRNSFEYFAQGITYYLIPESFPARYGVNQGWAKNNDPDLHLFLMSLDQAQGDLDKIACPI